MTTGSSGLSSEETIEQPKQTTERSFTNRISFGLLDRPETQRLVIAETALECETAAALMLAALSAAAAAGSALLAVALAVATLFDIERGAPPLPGSIPPRAPLFYPAPALRTTLPRRPQAAL